MRDVKSKDHLTSRGAEISNLGEMIGCEYFQMGREFPERFIKYVPNDSFLRRLSLLGEDPEQCDLSSKDILKQEGIRCEE